MSLNPRCYGLSQISHLVASINKKNYKDKHAEISMLVEIYGPEAEKYLFRCLINSVDFTTDGRNVGKDGQQLQLLMQEANSLITKPNFVSILCYAFENLDNKSLRPSSQLIPQVAKVLKLPKVQEVVFAMGLTASTDPDLKHHASQHLKNKLPELVRSYSDLSSGLEGGLTDAAIEVLHILLSHLLRNPEEEVGVSREGIDVFLETLRKDFPRERVPVVLAPLLYQERQDIPEDRLVPVSVALPSSVSSNHLADIIKDIGYVATASKQDMLEILKDYGKSQINPKCVAKVLGMMASTMIGLTDSIPFLGVSGETSHPPGRTPTTWDVKVFAVALQSLVPNLNWREVILELDYPGFYLSSPEGLSLIMTAFKIASKDPFPVETIYLQWQFPRGQLSWLQQALGGCPDFNITQYPYCSMDLEPLKLATTTEEARTWCSVNLIECLLILSEQGFYDEVMELFGVPMRQCPEVFFLGLVSAKTQWQVMQYELVSQLLPMFLANHPTYANALHYAWSGQSVGPHIQTMLIQVMADWYMSNETPDQTKLARILDVAQDLKILSNMLNANQFPFVIDLACWASRREFLKLDKWVSDKIKEHHEPFIAECIQFLVSRAPKPVVQGSELPHETITAILASLQPYISALKPELAEKLRMLINIHGPIAPKSRPTPLSMPGLGLTAGNASSLEVSGLGLPGTLGLPGLTTSPFAGSGLGGLGAPGSPGRSPIGSGGFGLHSGLSGLPSGSSPISGQSLFGNGSDPFGSLGMGSGSSNAAAVAAAHKQMQFQMQHQIRDPMTTKQASGMEIFGPEQIFSREVDDKANAYFQAIYSRGMNVDRLLELLKQFKDSSVKRDRDLFVCMLRNMFEEYKFFPQFPDKELQITGQLFGGIIEHGLVTYMTLSLALRYVLESLKKPSTSKMHLFGLAALDKFRSRLKEFPQYCASIASIPHFQQFPMVLKQYIHYGQQSVEPPLSQEAATPGGSTMPSLGGLRVRPTLPPLTSINTNTSTFHSRSGSTSSPLSSPNTSPVPQLSPSLSMPGGGTLGGGGTPGGSVVTTKPPGSPLATRRDPPSINTTNIDTLLVAADQQQLEKSQLPEELQDKVHFLFNNLSAANLQEKTDEFKSLIEEDHYDWVAQYLVMKRASIEPNFHNLYMSFLDYLGSLRLRKGALRETYRNIKVILQADKTSNNFSDRTILKNLGHWLGMQTLAKNRPILQIDLGLKNLILEAHLKGQQDLLYVVPFVAKVLESCAESKVFKPPNPWTIAIMSVLSELHAVPELKLNLKFEIEVLCKHLSLEIQDIPPSNLLNDAEKAKTLSQLSIPKDQLSAEGTQTGSGSQVPQPSPPQPQYHYEDVNASSVAGLLQQLQVNTQITLLQQFPQLKQCVKPAVEKAVQDLLLPVAERSIKIALTTTEHIIKKDFALDPDVHRMHLAAHHMVRHLTAGMAMITCREPLLLSISTNVKSAFTSTLRQSPNEEVKAMIEQAANQISAENTELTCAFIQKTAVEKAIPEMDKRFAEEFELRKLARNEGRRYCNPVALTYQAERMPEQIRLNVGGPNSQQAAVYEEFARCLPGFLPSASSTGAKFVPNEEFLQILLKCIQEISQHLRVALAPPNNPHVMMMRSLLEMTMQLRISQNYANVIALLQKALEGLLEGMNPPPSDPELFVSFRDCHLLILKMIQGPSGLGSESATRHVTRILLNAREDIKYSPRAIILLIGLQIVDMKQLDEYLAKAIENSRNLVALSCSIKLVNAIVASEKRETPITDKDLLKTKETLYRLAANVRQLPDSSAQLLEPFRLNHDIQLLQGSSILTPSGGGGIGELDRAPGAPTTMMHHNIMMGSNTELEDPPGLYEKVEYLLSEWVRHFHQPGLLREGDKIYAAYVARLQQQGILKSDDLITRFFRISVEMCVDLCYRTLNDPAINGAMARAKCYHTMDAFVKLVVVLVRYSGDATNTVTKVNLLNKVLVTVAHVLLQDHESRSADFHQLAYHRFFIMLLNDLNSPDPVFDAINFPVLHAFSHVYHIIRPTRAPGFAYSWLELISHRIFIAKLLLQTPQQKGWPLFHQLLIDLFRFLAPFLRNAELTKPTQLLYKGTLRVLLVLLHDFPEFLCDYHVSFCDVIPPNCIQMRNLILSAFPRNMRLPDPFTPNLKVEMLPDIAHAPRILPNYTQHIPANLKKDLENYIRTRAPVTFLQELRGHLQVSNEPGSQYNVSLMNALVLYVGTQAITFIHSKSSTPSTGTIAHTAHMDIFQHLVVDLDTEGRYLFLNAIANQLRYPNSHTHYFSCALLSLFAETNAEAIQEQITRVLLERLIVNRPHPWGLLITFIELIKNPTYNFWKHEFVHCAPEIEKLFESVAKSCMQKQPQTITAREDTHD